MKIFGFTLLRNGVKYDYPFFESLSSLSGLCEKVYVALGKSDDGTESSISDIPNLKIIPTVWDESLRKSGLILSQQTNIALDALRNDEETGWAFYLQADEVLNEADFDLIRRDLKKASATDCDAVSFRYLHFWQRYDRIAIGKRWYPQEIRAIRINSKIESYGDAQSFRKAKNIYTSDAHIFHYGHVREQKAYQKKLSEFGRWWHSDKELTKVLAKGAKKDLKEEAIPYFGPHPKIMRKRIGDLIESKPTILAYGNPGDYPEIKNKNILWTQNLLEVLFCRPEQVVLLENFPLALRPLQRARYASKVPLKMKSKQARAWTKEFWALLKFSEKKFSI